MDVGDSDLLSLAYPVQERILERAKLTVLVHQGTHALRTNSATARQNRALRRGIAVDLHK
jgi:hypothetical protein